MLLINTVRYKSADSAPPMKKRTVPSWQSPLETLCISLTLKNEIKYSKNLSSTFY